MLLWPEAPTLILPKARGAHVLEVDRRRGGTRSEPLHLRTSRCADAIGHPDEAVVSGGAVGAVDGELPDFAQSAAGGGTAEQLSPLGVKAFGFGSGDRSPKHARDTGAAGRLACPVDAERVGAGAVEIGREGPARSRVGADAPERERLAQRRGLLESGARVEEHAIAGARREAAAPIAHERWCGLRRCGGGGGGGGSRTNGVRARGNA